MKESGREFRYHCCHNAYSLNSKCIVSKLHSQAPIPPPNLVETQHLPKTYVFNLCNFLTTEFSAKPKISSLIQGQNTCSFTFNSIHCPEEGTVFHSLKNSPEHPQGAWLLLASERDIRGSKRWKSSFHPAKSTIALWWCDRKRAKYLPLSSCWSAETRIRVI